MATEITCNHRSMREEECSGPAPSSLKGVSGAHAQFDIVHTREAVAELTRSASAT